MPDESCKVDSPLGNPSHCDGLSSSHSNGDSSSSISNAPVLDNQPRQYAQKKGIVQQPDRHGSYIVRHDFFYIYGFFIYYGF